MAHEQHKYPEREAKSGEGAKEGWAWNRVALQVPMQPVISGWAVLMEQLWQTSMYGGVVDDTNVPPTGDGLAAHSVRRRGDSTADQSAS